MHEINWRENDINFYMIDLFYANIILSPPQNIAFSILTDSKSLPHKKYVHKEKQNLKRKLCQGIKANFLAAT